MEKVLQVEKLTKTYQSGSKILTVLNSVSFELEAGATLAIVGPSGSGKTTLLGLCAGLDRPSSGSVTLNNLRLENLTEDQRASIRNQYVGFVFQNFQLIPTLTALENVMIPAELLNNRHVKDDAVELLQKVGLGDRLGHYPVQLSGGEQQRVALARAFINKPKIMFADEPTGNLDAETSVKIEQLLFELNEQSGTTLVLVTHNLELAEKTRRILRISGGKVIADQSNLNETVNLDALPSNL